MNRFEDRVVVVTGGSVGIGKATAVAFAREGAKVALIDIDSSRGKEALREIEQSGGQAQLYNADVSDEASVQSVMQDIIGAWSRIDVLVNNAGIYRQGAVDGTTLDDWQQILAVNLTGPFLCTKYVLPAMERGGGGVVINVASEAGLVGIANQVAYNVSKGGLIAFTRSCAVDFAVRNIRVNSVCPGTTETPLVKEAVERADDPERARRALEQARPLNRLGDPEEIASAVVYLASDEAGYATGSIFSIDGGYTAQ